ncbi:MAG: hypothetical protein AAF600_00670 [Bacteroidota bacterium]
MIQPQPPGFKVHNYSFHVEVMAMPPIVWDWLNDTKTFTDTQIWPYSVEFYSPNPEKIPNGFNEGVLTNHTGPLINFAGVLTEITEDYRDLQYYYGSYAISFSLVRPFRLEFKTRDDQGSTTITCTISSYVKPTFYKTWDRLNKLFWKRFKKWSRKSIMKKVNSAL